MRFRRFVSLALLAATLGAMPAVTPADAATAGGPIDAVRLVDPSASKRFRKLLDYVGCIGAIIIVKDPGSALGAVSACGNMLKNWMEE